MQVAACLIESRQWHPLRFLCPSSLALVPSYNHENCVSHQSRLRRISVPRGPGTLRTPMNRTYRYENANAHSTQRLVAMPVLVLVCYYYVHEFLLLINSLSNWCFSVSHISSLLLSEGYPVRGYVYFYCHGALPLGNDLFDQPQCQGN